MPEDYSLTHRLLLQDITRKGHRLTEVIHRVGSSVQRCDRTFYRKMDPVERTLGVSIVARYFECQRVACAILHKGKQKKKSEA